MQFTEDQNRRDIVETLVLEMSLIIRRIQGMGLPTMQEVAGLQNIGQHVGQLIGEIAQDKREAERTKVYGDQLGNLLNVVKGFAQQLAQQQKAAAVAGNGKPGDDTAGKVASQQIIATAKAANMRESHAQRTAQRQIQFESEQRRDDEQHQVELRRELERQGVEDVNATIATGAEIQRNRLKSASESE